MAAKPSIVKYQPKFGRVLIEREIVEKTKGGIFIPNAKRHANCEGTIIALGESAGWTRAYDEAGQEISVRAFKVGDKVVFGRHAGAWLDSTQISDKDSDDGTLFICQDEDILAVINEQGA